MWKLLLAFVVFAGLAIFVLTRSGGDVDLTGEKHDVGHGAPAASAPAASAATPAASAASGG